jgi:hypothetical protein
MAVETKAGWIFAVRQLDEAITTGSGVPAATTTVAGKVKQITFTAQQGSTFADLAAVTAAYNALLTKLIAAGIMPAS